MLPNAQGTPPSRVCGGANTCLHDSPVVERCNCGTPCGRAIFQSDAVTLMIASMRNPHNILVAQKGVSTLGLPYHGVFKRTRLIAGRLGS